MPTRTTNINDSLKLFLFVSIIPTINCKKKCTGKNSIYTHDSFFFFSHLHKIMSFLILLIIFEVRPIPMNNHNFFFEKTGLFIYRFGLNFNHYTFCKILLPVISTMETENKMLALKIYGKLLKTSIREYDSSKVVVTSMFRVSETK